MEELQSFLAGVCMSGAAIAVMAFRWLASDHKKLVSKVDQLSAQVDGLQDSLAHAQQEQQPAARAGENQP